MDLVARGGHIGGLCPSLPLHYLSLVPVPILQLVGLVLENQNSVYRVNARLPLPKPYLSHCHPLLVPCVSVEWGRKERRTATLVSVCHSIGSSVTVNYGPSQAGVGIVAKTLQDTFRGYRLSAPSTRLDAASLLLLAVTAHSRQWPL